MAAASVHVSIPKALGNLNRERRHPGRASCRGWLCHMHGERVSARPLYEAAPGRAARQLWHDVSPQNGVYFLQSSLDITFQGRGRVTASSRRSPGARLGIIRPSFSWRLMTALVAAHYARALVCKFSTMRASTRNSFKGQMTGLVVLWDTRHA